ncbi:MULTISPECIES: LuxR family transcriptional regulator [Kitasatospora]|uniref:Putative LuxR family transcriptional regulator n=1 Tax=Kitasatospora setae (strain ATCC 33774 / DSM 43861 / JCM 3304 / KCC A-0304 / NBRC 14216 / KM-6054) TaxID=452652 RepID=E4NJ87_KITSK|nr:MULTISPECIES: LuxR family transcriptional regulator [Kitasatospora]BAJ33035.1 putative LuxR family transcriptional regulator [Kitasatospora setae KM-6054]
MRHDGGAPGFVGRQREVAWLVGAVRAAPAVVLVEGGAGVGKSALVGRALAEAGLPRERVLTGRCHPVADPPPYGPLLDALRRSRPVLREAAEVPPSTGALRAWLPDLADLLPEDSTGGGGDERYRLTQGLRALLDALGDVVLLIEDAQWADRATRELLLLLARDPHPGLSLLVTYRAEELPDGAPVLGTAYRCPPGVSGGLLRVEPLDEAEVLELVWKVLGTGTAAGGGVGSAPALAGALYERSGGLPAAIVEDLETLEGLRGDGRRADPVAALAGADLARGLRDSVVERLAGLGTAARTVAESAAVLDEPASEELLAEVSALPAEQVSAGLVEALRAGVLNEPAPARYAFRWEPARQVAYRRIPGPMRSALHRRAIEALRGREPQPLARIAAHTRALGDRDAWQQAAEAAAEQAVEQGDTAAAGPLLRELLAETDLAPERRGRAARALSGLAANAAYDAASTQVLSAIIADPRLPVADRGEVRLTLGLRVAVQGGDRAGFALIEQAADELIADRPARAARALVALAMDERDGAGAAAKERMARAATALEAEPDEEVAAAYRATRLTFQARDGDPELQPELDRLPRDASSPELVRQTTRALFNVGDISMETGHDQRAGRLLAESRALARQAAISYLECYSRIALLRLDGLAGRWQGLEERFEALGAEYPDVAMARVERAMLFGRMAAARGRLAVARAEFESAARYGERESQVTAALRAAAGLGGVELVERGAEAAALVLTPAVAILRQAGAWARAGELLPIGVEVSRGVGNDGAAQHLIEEAADALGGVDAPAAHAGLALARGVLLEGTDPGGAIESYRQARDAWRAIGRPYEVARVEERLARALAERDPQTAAERLAAAEATYTTLGAASDAARCQHVRRDLGLGRMASPGRRGYGEALSPRERQVAELLGQGASNQDIAQALFLSPRTVEHHVASVLRKLGVGRKEVAEALTETEG